MLDTDKVAVKSRTGGEVFYRLTEDGNVRTFNRGETQYVDFAEIKKLKYVPGGEYLIRNSLIISPEALEELDITVEPEYFYTENEITQILENGSLDQLEDTLNFAPKGVIELIQQIGVKIELPDTRKRKMIFEKTGFSIDGALAINETMNTESTEDDANKEKSSTPVRKTTPVNTGSGTGTKRKASAPATDKYKVVLTK